MKSDFTYDLLIVGGGISAVFLLKIIYKITLQKIALIEAGRGLGEIKYKNKQKL